MCIDKITSFIVKTLKIIHYQWTLKIKLMLFLKVKKNISQRLLNLLNPGGNTYVPVVYLPFRTGV